uniref:NaTx n=1 Tax=Centruroides hentzi TaxID=88313 RepID=A0A2I9LPB6_9SCOR
MLSTFVSLFLIVAVALLTYVDVEGAEVSGGYPVNRFNCTYPCYYGEDEEECQQFCTLLKGGFGYCYLYTCYCEQLPESVKQIKKFKVFGCSNGQWDITSVTKLYGR